jgi:hypothetical protein
MVIASNILEHSISVCHVHCKDKCGDFEKYVNIKTSHGVLSIQ